MGERQLCKLDAVGSIPSTSTNNFSGISLAVGMKRFMITIRIESGTPSGDVH